MLLIDLQNVIWKRWHSSFLLTSWICPGCLPPTSACGGSWSRISRGGAGCWWWTSRSPQTPAPCRQKWPSSRGRPGAEGFLMHRTKIKLLWLKRPLPLSQRSAPRMHQFAPNLSIKCFMWRFSGWMTEPPVSYSWSPIFTVARRPPMSSGSNTSIFTAGPNSSLR